MKTILILGAGTGGIMTAHELSKLTHGNVRIILFEKEQKNVFAPSLLWLMVGKRKAERIYRMTRSISIKSVEIVIGTIDSVDPEQASLRVMGKEYRGDYMVVSLGVEQSSEHDLDSFGSNFYTLDGAGKFYERLQNFTGGKIAVVIPSLPFKCPAAPYEAVMLIKDYLQKNGLAETTELSLYTPEPGPMGVAGKELSGQVRQLVESKGIRYFPEHQLVGATANTLTFNTGMTTEYDLLAFTPKHQCPEVIARTMLPGASGWIEVNRATLETQFPNVYAIGDITFIPLEMGKPLPKAGVFAHRQAEVVANNIAQKMSGNTEFKEFTGHGQCFLEIGSGKAGYAAGNFYGSPLPTIAIKSPSLFWHWMKVWFEKFWFLKYFSLYSMKSNK